MLLGLKTFFVKLGKALLRLVGWKLLIPRALDRIQKILQRPMSASRFVDEL